MTGTHIITARIKTADEIRGYGQTFGTMFVQPMLDSGIPELQKLVLTAYGQRYTNKTTFLDGCTDGLSAARISGFFKGDPHGSQRVHAGADLFRHHDFGNYFFDQTNHVYTRRNDIETRGALGETGVDFLEHAPVAYLEDNGVVATFPTIMRVDNGYGPDKNPYRPLLQDMMASAGQILTPRQMAMRDAILDQFTDAKVYAATQAMRSQKAHTVTLTLNTEHPVAVGAFDNFRAHVRGMGLG